MKSIEIIKMNKEDLISIKNENLWDYPLEEIDYLSSREEGIRRFALIDNRLYELEDDYKPIGD